MSLITPDGGLLFWMVVIFAIVLFILAKWGFPVITTAVEGRSKRIEDSLKKADEVDRREAGIAVEHEKMLAQARQEQGQILKDASAIREQILAQAKAEASEETAKMIAQAKTQIEADRKTAKMRLMALAAAIALLLTLLLALVYIMFSHRRHMRQLNNAYQHALESDQMKTAFIQNVSHEIRTPLNIISGFSQVIADPSLTNSAEERQYMSKMMQKSAIQVTTLIDEILSLSLIESTTELHREDRVAVNSLLRSVSKEYESLLNSDTTIRVESSLPDDFLLTTNRNMLNRVVSSLVDNAVKNTQQGSIIIGADSQPPTEEGSSPLLTISVTDTGTGVPKGEEERIFERFVKLDNFKEGIGLGLTIARRLIEKLGGSVALDQSYRQGARFVLTLPVEK